MEILKGTVIKGISGFYYVVCPEGEFTCKLRGRLRLGKDAPLPGDLVEISPLGEGKGVINKILPRKNVFIRPPVCNLDILVIVLSKAPPETDTFLADMITVTASSHGTEALICLNKTDIDKGEYVKDLYLSSGFRVFPVSAVSGEGIEALEKAIAGRITAFTGLSGVGKSTLLNALDPEGNRKTGDLSEKLSRGKHTTRHTELFKLPCGALAADTPGFSAFEIPKTIVKESLARHFRDFYPFLDQCRFTGCLHDNVKDCAVAEAVGSRIKAERYDSYIRLLRDCPWERDVKN